MMLCFPLSLIIASVSGTRDVTDNPIHLPHGAAATRLGEGVAEMPVVTDGLRRGGEGVAGRPAMVPGCGSMIVGGRDAATRSGNL